MIDNPEYKGPWTAKRIANPDYKGPWKAKEIKNPEYVADPELYAYDDFGFAEVLIQKWVLRKALRKQDQKKHLNINIFTSRVL